MRETIKRICELWFLSEPAYFAMYCMQRTESNTRMRCQMRVGQGRLEYNPELMQGMTLNEVEQLMRIEMIRLFLKHPYERQPEGIDLAVLSTASDITIADNYNRGQHALTLPLTCPSLHGLPSGECYEWYAKQLDKKRRESQQPGNADAADMISSSRESLSSDDDSTAEMAATDKAGLWQEDDMRRNDIDNLIREMQNWGSIPGDMVQQIIASTRARIDYRLIVQGFRGRILSNKRKLSRMHPNRRTGFDQMGSVRHFSTRLLVAVDVSGSISDTMLADFYGVINKMFRYGIEQIDCVQFDCAMGEVCCIRHAATTVNVTGRGGTSFQPVFDYLAIHPEYDGVIILTDGFAPPPQVADCVRTDVLWVCTSEQHYENARHWMELIGRACWMIL